MQTKSVTGEREREGETDRQTDRQAGRQADGRRARDRQGFKCLNQRERGGRERGRFKCLNQRERERERATRERESLHLRVDVA